MSDTEYITVKPTGDGGIEMTYTKYGVTVAASTRMECFEMLMEEMPYHEGNE